MISGLLFSVFFILLLLPFPFLFFLSVYGIYCYYISFCTNCQPVYFLRLTITPWRFSVPLDRDWVIRALNGHQCFSIKIYIEHDLNVRPCVMEKRASHGNLRGKTIGEILNNDIIYLNKDKIEGCRDCELRYACHDCRADSMSSNIYAKPYVCTYDAENGIWIDPDKYIKELFSSQE